MTSAIRESSNKDLFTKDNHSHGNENGSCDKAGNVVESVHDHT